MFKRKKIPKTGGIFRFRDLTDDDRRKISDVVKQIFLEQLENQNFLAGSFQNLYLETLDFDESVKFKLNAVLSEHHLREILTG